MSAAGRSRRPRWQAVRTQWLLLLAALLAALALLQWSETFWRLDFVIYDALMRGGTAPDDVVIVAIDDASIATIGRWPWRRSVHAALLERLKAAGARGVALDVIFTEPETATPDGDATLAAAMSRGPPTVLPLIASAAPGRGMLELRPIPVLERAAAALGHAQVEIDRDGIARSVFLREGAGRADRSHFVLALLERLAPGELAPLRGERHPDPGDAAAGTWVRDYRMMIPFLGPPGHFTRYSYADVLSGAVDDSRLRGRWVLVGATAQGLGDDYATPLSRDGLTTPGVELGANLLAALRSGSGIIPAGRLAQFVLSALPLLAAFAGFLALSPRRSLLLLGALWLVTLGFSALALHETAWWWPPAASLALLTAAYPLWNWRRLEATQRFLEVEFTRLMAERTPLARAPTAALLAPQTGGDPLQRRIDLVDAATTRLRDLRRLLSDTIANLPDAALVVDREGQVVLANPAASALFNTGSMLGQRLEPLLAATFADDPIDPVAVLGTQARVIEANAGARHLLLRSAPFHDDAGVRLGTILSLADITGLRELQRERDELVGFLSHDIRSPLSALLALTQLQRDSQRALPEAQFSQRAEVLASRSLELAEGFVALARAESVERASFQPFDLRDAVQDAVDETWAAAAERHVSVKFTAQAAHWPVLGHRGLLARAIVNLLGNALRFAPSGSTVKVEGSRESANWEIRVIDAGPGIEADLRARLFGPVQRGGATAPDTTSGAGAGPGLGLAFVRVAAARHGGVAGVRDPGQGSEFYLRVPAHDESD